MSIANRLKGLLGTEVEGISINGGTVQAIDTGRPDTDRSLGRSARAALLGLGIALGATAAAPQVQAQSLTDLITTVTGLKTLQQQINSQTVDLRRQAMLTPQQKQMLDNKSRQPLAIAHPGRLGGADTPDNASAVLKYMTVEQLQTVLNQTEEAVYQNEQQIDAARNARNPNDERMYATFHEAYRWGVQAITREVESRGLRVTTPPRFNVNQGYGNQGYGNQTPQYTLPGHQNQGYAPVPSGHATGYAQQSGLRSDQVIRWRDQQSNEYAPNPFSHNSR